MSTENLQKEINYPEIVGHKNSLQVQGDPPRLRLQFVDFDLEVPPCCLHVMPILPRFSLAQAE